MNIKNLTNPTAGSNTGKIDSPLYGGLVVSGILVPFDWTFAVGVGDSAATILANLETALSAVLLHDTYLSRGFYVGPFDAFNDKSEETQYQTLGYGKKVLTQRSVYTKEYQIVDGGVQYWKALQTFNGKTDQYKWLEIDNEGVIYGTETLDATTGLVTGMQGLQMSSFEAQDRKQANRTEIEGHMLNITLAKSSECNERLFTIQTGIELDSYVSAFGVQDIKIRKTGVMVAKVVSFAITTGDGSINMCSALPALISTSYITLTNKNTGSTAITITSFAIVNGLAVLTLSGAGAGWVPGDTMQIQFKAISVLSTAGYKYYESNVEEVVMVA